MLNPKTGKYFGFSDFWAPSPSNTGRTSGPLPAAPDTWDDVLVAGAPLKAAWGTRSGSGCRGF